MAQGMRKLRINQFNSGGCVKSSKSLSLTVLLFCGALALVSFCQRAGAEEQEPWNAPARAAKKKNPIATSAESVGKGKDLFVKNCLTCHGPEGKGDGPGALACLPKKVGNLSDSKLWKQPDGALFWKVTTGNKPMVSFEATLSEEDRWNVINFVRTLSPKPAGE
jgi:mono/diheme cytochrome c family protein